MPDNKFDYKDTAIIALAVLCCVVIIAMSVAITIISISRSDNFDKYFDKYYDEHISNNTNEACIVSQSLERQISDNYAMPDSDIVRYDVSHYFSDYVNIDYSHLDGSTSFFDATYSLDDIFSLTSIGDELPEFFQVTAFVYNFVAVIYASVDDQWQYSETSILVGGAESNSIYSYSYPTYELVYSWRLQAPLELYTRNSVFSAGDSISISARVDGSSDFVQGMEFEVEYEFEITRVYGYNLTSYIQGEQQNYYESGYDDGRQIGYNEGLDVGTEQGYNQGYTEGNLAGYQNGYQEGYSAGESDGYNEGFDIGTEQGYTQGYDEGYDRGFIVGKNTGFNEGVQQAGDYTFFSLIASVFDAPLRVILGEWVDTNNDGVVDELTGGFLNFYVPVLDVDLAPFILSMFTVCIIIIVIRFVLARL